MTVHRRIFRLMAFLGIAACGLATSCPEPDYLEPVGEWPGGPAEVVAVAGSFAYVGGRSSLAVMDISDPAAPHEVGRVFLRHGHVRGIEVSGDHAYVAADSGGFRVIDVSTPSAPVEVGVLETPDSFVSDVAVSGSYAYTATQNGLQVIDVSTPSAPVEVGSFYTGAAFTVALTGNHVIVANTTDLQVFDVATPSAPIRVGSVNIGGQASRIAVSGDYAYVAAGTRGLRVVDISTPSDPFVAWAVQPPGNARDVAVSGHYAYVADGSDGLRVLDLSEPSRPVDVALFQGGFLSVAVSGDHAYALTDSGALWVIDVSTPSVPVGVGYVNSPAVVATAVAVAGNYAYVAGAPPLNAGLFVLDVDAPSAPVEVGFVETPYWTDDVEVSAGYAYVAAGDAGLRVIDVGTPSSPVEVGFVDMPSSAWHVAVTAGYAYVAGGDAGLRVVDVSSPSAPVEVAFVGTTGVVYDVAVADGYAYVAAGNAGLRVIDIFTPPAPIEVGHVETEGGADFVAVSGDYAYVLNGPGGLRVIDVSTPSAPVEVGSVRTMSTTRNIAVSGDCAYAPTWEGLSVIDVSTPSAPVEVGFVDAHGVAWDVAVSGGYVYLATFEAGVQIFRTCGGSTSPTVSASFIPAAALAAGAEGAFFSTDVEINNSSLEAALVTFLWLPRGQDNSEPLSSDIITLDPGASLQLPDALATLFGLEPDSVGAIAMLADSPNVIAMSRTYNSPAGESAGTFGQGLPAIRATEMIPAGETRRIIFMSEDPDLRANLGCVNATSSEITVDVSLFDALGSPLETIGLGLPPYSHKQINRIFDDYSPVNGYVDVSTATENGSFYCYGSVLDNITSDPTTILPQVPSDTTTFIPGVAVAAGAGDAFFRTDLDLSNAGDSAITYTFRWLPRGRDNSSADQSEPFNLGAGMGVRLANVLAEVFGLEPDSVGALAIDASSEELLAMSRTYNLPGADAAGTFGQGIPGVPSGTMIPTGVKKRIIFMSENDDFRANLGCVNGTDSEITVAIDLFDSDGERLETTSMVLAPLSNKQINRIFEDYAPVNGYVDVWTTTPGAAFTCYGSVLDNLTSDPTTVPPQ